jgi:hypothetical protein
VLRHTKPIEVVFKAGGDEPSEVFDPWDVKNAAYCNMAIIYVSSLIFYGIYVLTQTKIGSTQ